MNMKYAMRSESTMVKPNLVSLFSGCGGMDMGFKRAGFKGVWANDFDEDAQQIFRMNVGEIDGRDIKEVGAEEIPDCDIVIAGFPCQPFSNAGNRRGTKDSRGDLYKECIRIIEKKRPKVFVFENVKGILSICRENGKRLIDEMICELEKLNYMITYKVINSSDYGVPQNRQRFIMVGVLDGFGKRFRFPKEKKKENLELKYVLDIPPEIKNQISWELSPQAKELVEHIPEGGSWKDIKYELLPERLKRIRNNMKKYHSPNFYRRFSREEISGTITASAQPEKCGIIHPTQNRRYTIREVARIQSFPDDFIFDDSSKKKICAMYKVIGNAVPPQMAYEIANEIMKQYFGRGKEKK